MKPTEKIWCTAGLLTAWIGIWLTGPENPADTYDTGDRIVFFAVLAIGVYGLVRFWSQLAQQRYNEELKKKIRRRDSRPRR